MRAARGDVRRLMIFTPPQHGKSTLCSHYFPAWYVGTNPHKRMILVSYEANFAASWGRKVRDVLDEYGQEIFGGRLRNDSSARDNWDLDVYQPQGGMATAGIGGPITGKTGNLVMIDDPIKNAVEAMSDATRVRNYEWFFSAALTRVSDDGIVVIIQTRWAQNDLSGQLIKDMQTKGERWEIVSLPAISETDEEWPTGWSRSRGSALCPGLFSIDTLETRRKAMSEYLWSALYQQRPIPLSGSIFKEAHFRRWRMSADQPGHIEILDGLYKFDPWKTIRFLTIDPALKEKEIGAEKAEDPDYTVMCTWCALPTPSGPMLVMLDLLRARTQAPETIEAMKRAREKWRPAFLATATAGAGLAIFQFAKAAGLAVREIREVARANQKIEDGTFLRLEGSKTARAIQAVPMMAEGRFFVPESAPWLPEYLDEMLSFPLAAHDDQCDATVFGVAVAEKVSVRTWPTNGNGHHTGDAGFSDHRRPDDAPVSPTDGYFVANPF